MRHILPLLVFALTAVAQRQPPSTTAPNAPGQTGRGGSGVDRSPALISPEVLSDRRVIFRLRAPKATEVNLTGEFWEKTGVSEKMTRNAEGVWSVTMGPLTPDIYGYSFSVDGVTISDPANGWVFPGVRSSSQSAVRVPGPEEEFLEVQPIPHGDVRMVYFKAESVNQIRRMHIYFPPGYDSSKDLYPVLYLIHGAGEDDAGWVNLGMANIILDNLIAQGKAKPMIVVMPSYQGLASGSPARVQENYPLFAKSFAQDILPFVEKTYRVIAKPEGRAVGGLSPPDIVPDMILPILDKVGYWLCTSNGLRAARMEFYDQQFPGALNNPANAKRVKLLMGDGSNAMTFSESTYMAGEFKRRGYDVTFYQTEGTHSYRWFRRYLNELAPKLFR
jgi:Putative esterase/Carbohydrate-binding module 48 (Isoamylase N-terminal domain)